jgi:hypothetical protein
MSAVADVGEYHVNSGLGVSASCSDTTRPDCAQQQQDTAARQVCQWYQHMVHTHTRGEHS